MGNKLAESILEEARLVAQRRGHREVDVLHVVSALSRQGALLRELSVRGMSVALLNEKIDVELARVPEARGYRDGTHSVGISAAVEAALARHHGVRGVVYGTSLNAIAQTLLEHPSIARLLPDCHFYETAIRDLYVASDAAMNKLRQKNLLIDHTLMALTLDPRFAEALTLVGHSPAHVLAALEDLVTPGYKSMRLASVDALVRSAIVRANLAKRRALTTEFFVVDLLRSAYVEKPMAKLQIDPYDLLFAYVHRTLMSEIPPAGKVAVFFYDDDFTTMETVVDALTETFNLVRAEATRCMLDVHRNGKAEIVRLDASEARAKITAVRKNARERGMPLRIEAAAIVP